MIDLRSDTVTQPTPEMREVMRKAPLGDDVFGEDPSVNELQTSAAERFGMEAALFCPSGTMTNQIAIKCHTQPGDEVICDRLSHIYQYEGGGIAFHSGCSVSLIEGDRGRITASQITENINNRGDVHKAVSSLVTLENTSNRGGGSCYQFAEFLSIRKTCNENNLKLHLDGARLFNAIVKGKEREREYGKIFDSLSICLSKGLGAPVGSLLLGDQGFITKARRIRKIFGGGMRQAGMLAAAGLYAMDHHVQRLEQDHLHARQLAEVLAVSDFVTDIIPVETNIILFSVSGKYTAKEFTDKLKENNILAIAISSRQVRMVTHLDITPKMIKECIQVIQKLS